MTTVMTFPGGQQAGPPATAGDFSNLPTGLVPPSIFGGGEPPRHEPGLLDFNMVLAVLRRRWLLITTTIVTITGLSVAYALTRPPTYAATAKVMVGLPTSGNLNLGSLITGMSGDGAKIENEVQLLQSRSLAKKTIEAGGFDELPEFNPALEDPDVSATWLDQIRASIPSPGEVIKDLGASLGLAPPAPANGAADAVGSGRDPMADVVDNFLGSLEVWPEGRSHVISLGFESRSPMVAAHGANQLAETFIEQRLEDKLESLRRTSGWLDTRLEALRADAAEKEAAVEAYRSEEGLTASQSSGLAAERLKELNRELAIAGAAEAAAEARWQKVEEVLESDDAQSLPAVLASGTIQDLRETEAEAVSRRAELSRELGPRHPRMIELTSHLSGIRQQLRDETARIIAGVRNEHDVAKARVARIEHDIAQLEERLSGRNDAEAQLRVLEREAEAAQDVYRTFLTQANTSGQVETLEVPDARLISAADIPEDPSAPKKKMLVAIGFAFATLAALALAFGLELMDRRFRTPEQIRSRLRLPLLGVVPAVGSVTGGEKSPHDRIIEGPESAFGEAVRSLRTAITMQGQDRPIRTMLLTSSVQGEGKTSLALALGRQAAQGGKKAIVIDCDLRLPRVHERVGIPNDVGMIGFLEGAGFSEVVRADPDTGLHVIPAGLWQRNAPELLGSGRMRELIDLLQTRYDLVLIDTPPLLPVSDASLLAGLADLALLVIGWPNARPDTVDAAAQRLRAAAGRVPVAAVLNNVDVNKAAGYGFAEVDAYRGRYGRYYAAA